MDNVFQLPEFHITLKMKNKQPKLCIVKEAKDAAELARTCFDADTIEWNESFIIIALNQANKPLGFYKASSGGMTGTVADPRMIFQFALLSCAAHIIIAHNHPSGSLVPSRADKELTAKIVNAGLMLDITVLDHIIVTKDSHYSFADNGEI